MKTCHTDFTHYTTEIVVPSSTIDDSPHSTCVSEAGPDISIRGRGGGGGGASFFSEKKIGFQNHFFYRNIKRY